MRCVRTRAKGRRFLGATTDASVDSETMSETRTVEPGRLTRAARWPLERLGALWQGISRALPSAIEDLFRDRCPQYAASISFHVLFSLFPLTIVLVSVFGLVLQDDELRQTVIDDLLGVLPVSEKGQANVQSSIEGIASPLSAIGFISLIALIWGASGMMASIRIGLEAALKVDRGRPAAHAKLVDFVVVAATGVLVLVVVGLSAFAAFFSRGCRVWLLMMPPGLPSPKSVALGPRLISTREVL